MGYELDNAIENFMHRIGRRDARAYIMQKIQCRTGRQGIHNSSFYRRMKAPRIDRSYGAHRDRLSVQYRNLARKRGRHLTVAVPGGVAVNVQG